MHNKWTIDLLNLLIKHIKEDDSIYSSTVLGGTIDVSSSSDEYRRVESTGEKVILITNTTKARAIQIINDDTNYGHFNKDDLDKLVNHLQALGYV